MKKLKLSNALFFSFLLMVTLFIINACKKENSATAENNSKKLSVFLTDHPCNFDSFFVDIRYVEVKIDTSREHMMDDHYGDHDMDDDDDHHNHDSYGYWDTLAISPGVYNVMDLRNGVDTLLGTVNLPAGAIRKIRITLGTDSRVVAAGVSYPLSLLPGRSNYVYVKIDNEDEDDDHRGNSSIWLDFNVCESVVMHNGMYYLKPFIIPFGQHSTGSIEGKVAPPDAKAVIKAYNSTDSAMAIPEEHDGEFKIRGLKAGVYSLSFTSPNGYRDTTIQNITVRAGAETKIPLVTLKK